MSQLHHAHRTRDYEFAVTFEDEDGDAINITGSTWTFALYPEGEDDAVATAVPSIGSAAGGRINIAIPAADMDFAGGLHVGELVRTDTGSDVWARFSVAVANVGQIVGGAGEIIQGHSPGIFFRVTNIPPGP
jgi:hypothetical protein